MCIAVTSPPQQIIWRCGLCRLLTHFRCVPRTEAIEIGVPKEQLKDEDILVYDSGGEWAGPNPSLYIQGKVRSVQQKFAQLFDTNMSSAMARCALPLLGQLVGMAAATDDTQERSLYQDVLWRFLLGWTDPDVVLLNRQTEFLALIPSLLRDAHRGPQRGSVDIDARDCSCQLAGERLQAAFAALMSTVPVEEKTKTGSRYRVRFFSPPHLEPNKHVMPWTGLICASCVAA
jgi:hypothetical protein